MAPPPPRPLSSSPEPAGCSHSEPLPRSSGSLAPASHLLPGALSSDQVTFWRLSPQGVSFSSPSPSPWPLREDGKQAALKTHHCPQLKLITARSFRGFHTHLTPVRHSAAKTCPARGANAARSSQLLGTEKEDDVTTALGPQEKSSESPPSTSLNLLPGETPPVPQVTGRCVGSRGRRVRVTRVLTSSVQPTSEAGHQVGPRGAGTKRSVWRLPQNAFPVGRPRVRNPHPHPAPSTLHPSPRPVL